MKRVLVFICVLILLLTSCSKRKEQEQSEEMPLHNNKELWNDWYDGKIFFEIDDIELSILESDYKYYEESGYDKETLEALLKAGVKSGCAVYSNGALYIEFKKYLSDAVSFDAR